MRPGAPTHSAALCRTVHTGIAVRVQRNGGAEVVVTAGMRIEHLHGARRPDARGTAPEQVHRGAARVIGVGDGQVIAAVPVHVVARDRRRRTIATRRCRRRRCRLGSAADRSPGCHGRRCRRSASAPATRRPDRSRRRRPRRSCPPAGTRVDRPVPQQAPAARATGPSRSSRQSKQVPSTRIPVAVTRRRQVRRRRRMIEPSHRSCHRAKKSKQACFVWDRVPASTGGRPSPGAR